MGFDLYGMNPYNPNKAVKPTIDWDSQPSRKQTDKYFKEKGKYQEEVVGDYFRNNVWWWRPLASYVIKFTGCIDESDQVAWSENGGHEVDDQTAKQIHNQLMVLIESGHTKKFEDDYEKERLKAEKHNDKVEKKLSEFERDVCYRLDKKNLAPNDFPKADKDKWDEIWNSRKWNASYPFSVENVKEFAEFCRFSGGFKIC